MRTLRVIKEEAQKTELALQKVRKEYAEAIKEWENAESRFDEAARIYNEKSYHDIFWADVQTSSYQKMVEIVKKKESLTKETGNLGEKFERLKEEAEIWMNKYNTDPEFRASMDKEDYNSLIDRMKNSASSETDFQYLANQFRSIIPYENSQDLADECYKRFCVLKDQRERREAEWQKQQQQLKEQRKQWKALGLCDHCGGKLSFFIYWDSRSVCLRPSYWSKKSMNRKCKTCGKLFQQGDKGKIFKRFWLAGVSITAVLSALSIFVFPPYLIRYYVNDRGCLIILSSFSILIPFAILFFVRNRTGFTRGGFRRFIRVVSVIAQIIISWAFFGLGHPFASIFLFIACIMAFALPLNNINDESW